MSLYPKPPSFSVSSDLAFPAWILANNAINVKQPGNGLAAAKGDEVTDDTTALQAIFNYAESLRKTVFIPAGTYIHTGLIIKTELVGENKYKSVLKNTGAGTPCLKVRGHWFNISNLSIFGNGTLAYSSDATTGTGILFDGPNATSGYVANANIIDCQVMRNGGHGIDFSGSCWIINVDKCYINYNKLRGINMDNSDGGQKNAINITNSSVDDNGYDGILAFGTSINIKDNVIEGNLRAGISLNCEDTANYLTQDVGLTSVNIEGNYFEINKRGHISIKGGVYAGPFYSDITSVTIKGNYGSQSLANFEAGYDTLVKLQSNGTSEYNSRIFRFRYDHNYFGQEAGVIIFDGGNQLRDDSTIIFTPTDATYWKNFARAVTPTLLKYKAINGYFFAKGITYTTPVKSDDVASGTVVWYPILLSTGAKLRRLYLYVNTDSTNFSIQLECYGRNGKTVDAFTTFNVKSDLQANKSGSQLLSFAAPEEYGQSARIADTISEAYIKVTVTRTDVGTYLYLGSPEMQYLD